MTRQVAEHFPALAIQESHNPGRSRQDLLSTQGVLQRRRGISAKELCLSRKVMQAENSVEIKKISPAAEQLPVRRESHNCRSCPEEVVLALTGISFPVTCGIYA